MFTELENDSLQSNLAESEITFVQYSASWCGNCRLIKPTFKRLGEESESENFLLVDAEKFPNSRNLAEVTNLPTFAAFKNGQLVKQIQTNKPAVLKDFIHEITNN